MVGYPQNPSKILPKSQHPKTLLKENRCVPNTSQKYFVVRLVRFLENFSPFRRMDRRAQPPRSPSTEPYRPMGGRGESTPLCLKQFSDRSAANAAAAGTCSGPVLSRIGPQQLGVKNNCRRNLLLMVPASCKLQRSASIDSSRIVSGVYNVLLF